MKPYHLVWDLQLACFCSICTQDESACNMFKALQDTAENAAEPESTMAMDVDTESPLASVPLPAVYNDWLPSLTPHQCTPTNVCCCYRIAYCHTTAVEVAVAVVLQPNRGD